MNLRVKIWISASKADETDFGGREERLFCTLIIKNVLNTYLCKFLPCRDPELLKISEAQKAQKNINSFRRAHCATLICARARESRNLSLLYETRVDRVGKVDRHQILYTALTSCLLRLNPIFYARSDTDTAF